MKNSALKFILATIMIAASVLFGVKIANIDTVSSPVPNENSSIDPTRIMLKFFDGEVSLFEGNMIIETFEEINFSTLPATDQDKLTEGIELESLEEAYSLVEDFDG